MPKRIYELETLDEKNRINEKLETGFFNNKVNNWKLMNLSKNQPNKELLCYHFASRRIPPLDNWYQ